MRERVYITVGIRIIYNKISHSSLYIKYLHVGIPMGDTNKFCKVVLAILDRDKVTAKIGKGLVWL